MNVIIREKIYGRKLDYLFHFIDFNLIMNRRIISNAIKDLQIVIFFSDLVIEFEDCFL